MSQATSIEQDKTQNYEGIRLPIDGLIEWVADKVGGSKSREVVRFLKFGFVGTLGAVIDLGVSNLLMATMLAPVGDLQVINTNIAQTVSFIVAITSNFFWNRYWTYPDSRSRSLSRQLMLFAFICTVGWLGRFAWISFATKPFGAFVTSMTDFSEHVSNQLGSSLAIFVGIFVVMIWNFVVNRLWTFNDVE